MLQTITPGGLALEAARAYLAAWPGMPLKLDAGEPYLETTDASRDRPGWFVRIDVVDDTVQVWAAGRRYRNRNEVIGEVHTLAAPMPSRESVDLFGFALDVAVRECLADVAWAREQARR